MNTYLFIERLKEEKNKDKFTHNSKEKLVLPLLKTCCASAF